MLMTKFLTGCLCLKSLLHFQLESNIAGLVLKVVGYKEPGMERGPVYTEGEGVAETQNV